MCNCAMYTNSMLLCATECSTWSNAWRNGRVSFAACYRSWFPATRPCVFCWLKIIKTVILIQQTSQEKFAEGKWVLLVMIGFAWRIKMVNKRKNSGLERVAGLTRPMWSLAEVSSSLWLILLYNIVTFLSSLLSSSNSHPIPTCAGSWWQLPSFLLVCYAWITDIQAS